MAKSPVKKPKPSDPAIHSYQKVILRPGSFNIPAKSTTKGAFKDDAGRWWIKQEFSIERLQRIADNSRKILESKIKIPAPFAHRDGNRKYVSPVKLGSDGASLVDLHDKPLSWDSSLNGGFWGKPLEYVQDASQVNPEFAPGPGLVGVVDTFGDPSDLNSPAGKVSTTVQETSIGLLPKYQPPGWAEPMEDYIAHIAMPVHAIEPGQDNFIAMSEDDEDEIFAVSMSAMIEPGGNSIPEPGTDDPLLVEVLGLLKQLKIDLPEDTTSDNLIERLNLVLRQKIADQADNGNQNPLTTPPAGSTAKPAPIAMSQDNPSVESAFAKSMLVREAKRTKETLLGRLSRLKLKGLAEDVATEITSDIQAISMSAEDLNDEGEFPTPLAETKIALLERTHHTITGSVLDDDLQMSVPDGSTIEPNPNEMSEDIGDDYIAGIIDRALPVPA